MSLNHFSVPNILWSIDLAQPFVGPSLIADNLLLLPTSRSGATEQSAMLHALDLPDGAPRWQRSFEHAFISGLVRAPSPPILVSLTSTHLLHGEGTLLALDADVEERWRWTGDAQRVSAPAVSGETICFTVDTNTLVVLDLVSGHERAKVPLEASASLSAPALVDGVAYVPCRGPHLLAVGVDGGMRWHYTDDDSDAWLDNTPVVVDEHLFAVLTTGAVLALHTADGSLAWRVDVGPSGKSLSPPVTDADNQRLYVGARDGLYALNLADGDELWRFSTERRIEAAPVLHAGVVYAACHDHHLYALDAARGEELWRCEVERRIEISPVLARCGDLPEHCVIIADRGGTITAVARPLSAAEHEAAGHWLDAAKFYENLGQQEHAAELYGKAGDWRKAAELWCELERPLRQAEALEHYARSLGETSCSDEERAAAWQAAAHAFESEGKRERVATCRREVARCLRLPIITLDAVDKGLVLNSWSRLRFIVRNEGFGTARNLVIRAEGEQFEGQVTATRRIETLRGGRERVDWLDVCPREHGDSVPLRVRAEYRDRTGEMRVCEHTIYIPVAPVEARRQAGQTYNVFVSGGGAAAVGDGAAATGPGGVAVSGEVGGDVSLNTPATPGSMPMKANEDSPEGASLRHQLTEARENLRLIEERMSEYVLRVKVPLQLIKEGTCSKCWWKLLYDGTFMPILSSNR